MRQCIAPFVADTSTSQKDESKNGKQTNSFGSRKARTGTYLSEMSAECGESDTYPRIGAKFFRLPARKLISVMTPCASTRLLGRRCRMNIKLLEESMTRQQRKQIEREFYNYKLNREKAANYVVSHAYDGFSVDWSKPRVKSSSGNAQERNLINALSEEEWVWKWCVV